MIRGMKINKTSDEKKKFKVAAREGQLNVIINMSHKFSNDVRLLNEALIESCRGGHLDVVKR